jgi:hypothetical protein
MIWAGFLKLLRTSLLAVIALGAATTIGNAQSAYQGKFTLEVETSWEGVTIPPGDYSFVLTANSFPYPFHLQGKDFSAIIVATATEKLKSKHPQLNLVDISDVPTVQTFDAPELGVSFRYWTSTRKHAGHREARQKTTPATDPAAQVSENRTSIAVHTAGR